MTDDQQIIALGALRPAQPVEDQARHSPSQAPNQHPPAQVTFDRMSLQPSSICTVPRSPQVNGAIMPWISTRTVLSLPCSGEHQNNPYTALKKPPGLHASKGLILSRHLVG